MASPFERLANRAVDKATGGNAGHVSTRGRTPVAGVQGLVVPDVDTAANVTPADGTAGVFTLDQSLLDGADLLA